MENRDGQKNEFWNVVQDAINTGDYQQLNQQVRETIDDTVEGIRGSVQYVSREWGKAWQEAARTNPGRYQKSAAPGYQPGRDRQPMGGQKMPALYSKNPAGQGTGMAMAIFGYLLTGMFALSTFVMSIFLAVDPSPGRIVSVAFMGMISLGCLGVGVAGTSMRGLTKRFKKYIRLIGNRSYCTVEELSNGMGRDKKAVLRDLKKMIDKRMFLQGHLDKKETCLIVTDEMYQQYLTVEEQAKERERQHNVLEQQRSRMPEECQKILAEGEAYIRYIRECNEELPGEEISEKLSRLELIITRIFMEVEKNPSLAGELRKFMNYYLPTTRKLVDAYREMDKEPISGKHIESTKREIEDTLDTINQAFENLLNSFFKDKALDISSDISVLHTMLAQEGLTKNEFESLKEKEKKS